LQKKRDVQLLTQPDVGLAILSPALQICINQYLLEGDLRQQQKSEPSFKLFFGKYIINEVTCTQCKFISYIPNEKMTDVNIATEMLIDAFQDRFDTALLISADSDLKGPLVAIRKLCPDKKIIVAFPPERRSWDLRNIAHGYVSIGERELRNSQFPDEIFKPDGYKLKRPEEWR